MNNPVNNFADKIMDAATKNPVKPHWEEPQVKNSIVILFNGEVLMELATTANKPANLIQSVCFLQSLVELVKSYE